MDGKGLLIINFAITDASKIIDGLMTQYQELKEVSVLTIL
jgi:hypothetical protein